MAEAYSLFGKEVKGYYNGSILAIICSEREYNDGNGYGVKIETLMLQPCFVPDGFLEIRIVVTFLSIINEGNSGIKYFINTVNMILLQGIILHGNFGGCWC